MVFGLLASGGVLSDETSKAFSQKTVPGRSGSAVLRYRKRSDGEDA